MIKLIKVKFIWDFCFYITAQCCQLLSSEQLWNPERQLIILTLMCITACSENWSGSMRANSRLTHRVAVQQEEAVCIPFILHRQVKRMYPVQVCLFLHCREENMNITVFVWVKEVHCPKPDYVFSWGLFIHCKKPNKLWILPLLLLDFPVQYLHNLWCLQCCTIITKEA